MVQLRYTFAFFDERTRRRGVTLPEVHSCSISCGHREKMVVRDRPVSRERFGVIDLRVRPAISPCVRICTTMRSQRLDTLIACEVAGALEIVGQGQRLGKPPLS